MVNANTTPATLAMETVAARLRPVQALLVTQQMMVQAVDKLSCGRRVFSTLGAQPPRTILANIDSRSARRSMHRPFSQNLACRRRRPFQLAPLLTMSAFAFRRVVRASLIVWRLEEAVANTPLLHEPQMPMAGLAITSVSSAAAMATAPGTRALCSSGAIDPIESAKRVAARRAVDEYVKSGQVVGVGSGSTITYAVERLAELKKGGDFDVTCVPTSFQAEQVRGRVAAEIFPASGAHAAVLARLCSSSCKTASN